MALERNEADIFAAVLDVTEVERPAFLQEVCGNDVDFRDRLHRYLRAHLADDGPLDASPADMASVMNNLIKDCRVGSRVGPYKLLEQIGAGGMGVVFMAEQREPVKRTVALKIIKPGMDTEQVVARFEAERQALALMNHPNIAKVLDAGTTESGLPYFAMELVKGIPVTEYCDEHRFDTRQRLELFCLICRAVQHAHLKGVIHRDLKPSNVLVELHDVHPVPKVIDFGVAKATNQSLTDRSLHTGFSQLIGTPTYMSPEQAQLSGLDVDTRSDVYSLAVILYELLTGETPFDRETLRQADFDEMRRIIREDEPLRPSDRVSTLLAERATTITSHRRTDRRGLTSEVRNELDWIVMKAMEKDRTRRYESVSAMATDIQRYLDDEPVQACPPSIAYRTRKYARRHKVLLTTAAITLGTMVTATAVSAWYAVDARAARKLADQRLAVSDADYDRAINAVDMVINQVDSDQFAKIPGMDLVRDELTEGSIELYEDIIAAHRDNYFGNRRVANTYNRLQILYRDRGQLDKGIEAGNAAIALFARLVDQSPNDLALRLEFAYALEQTAWSSTGVQRRRLLEESMAMSEYVQQAEDSRSEQFADVRKEAAARLATTAISLGVDLQHAEDLAIKSIELGGDDFSYLARAHHRLARVRANQGRFDEAEVAARHSIDYASKSAKQVSDRVARQLLHDSHLCLASVLADKGNKQAQRDAQAKALVIATKLSQDYPDRALYKQWVLNGRSGEPAAIESILSDSIRKARSQTIQLLVQSNEIDALQNYVQDLKREGRDDEAEQLLDSIVPALGKALAGGLHSDWNHWQYAIMKGILIDRLVHQQDFNAAQSLLDKYHFGLGADHVAQARLYQRMGRDQSALESFNNALKIAPSVPVFQHRGELLHHMRRFSEAAADFDQALEIDPGQWHIQKRRAKARFYAGDYRGALSDLQRVRQETPDDLSALRWISIRDSVLCEDAEYRSGFRELVTQALRAYPDDFDTHLIHSGVLIAQGDLGAAKRAYNRAMELAGEDYAQWINTRYADFLGQSEFYSEQLEFLSELIELDSSNALLWNQRGVVHLKRNHPEMAMVDFDKSIELNPDPVVYLNRSAAHQELDDYASALDDMKASFRLMAPRFGLRNRAALMALAGNAPQQYRAICRSFFDDPSLPTALTESERALAAWMAALGSQALTDYDVPVQLARDSIAADPLAILPQQTLGALLFRSNDLVQSIEHLAKAISLPSDPRGSVAYCEYFLAMAYHRLGDHDSAVAAFDRAQDLANQEITDGEQEISWQRRATLKLLHAEAESVLSEPKMPSNGNASS